VELLQSYKLFKSAE